MSPEMPTVLHNPAPPPKPNTGVDRKGPNKQKEMESKKEKQTKEHGNDNSQ